MKTQNELTAIMSKKPHKADGFNIYYSQSDVFEMLNEINGNQWISVKDRLPEYGQSIVWIEQYGRKEIGVMGNKSFIYGDYATDIDNCRYWMPLPKIPKEFDKYFK